MRDFSHYAGRKLRQMLLRKHEANESSRLSYRQIRSRSTEIFTVPRYAQGSAEKQTFLARIPAQSDQLLTAITTLVKYTLDLVWKLISTRSKVIRKLAMRFFIRTNILGIAY